PDGTIANPVGALSDPVTGALTVQPSVENPATDGSDYIEGNGGSDVIFGDLGQDDIIGGSSNLFGQTTAGLRPDAGDILFGGAGARTARNILGDGANSITGQFADHARDADQILGDNGNLFHLVTVGGASQTF